VFDRFTNLAKRSITLAQDEAMDLGHDFIGTEHLLLGLLGLHQGLPAPIFAEVGITLDGARSETVRMLTAAGISATASQDAAAALASIGIDVDEIKRRADDTFGPGRFRYPRPPFTRRAQGVLIAAVREADALGRPEIGPEHMVLGLLEEPSAGSEGESGQTEPGQADGASGAVMILTALGADPAALRTALLARATAAAS
jgi:ATP-dependent Clp protease ATP-binding subunit ClpA